MAGHSRSKNGVASLAYVPAVHVFLPVSAEKTWMPGTSPGMTRSEGRTRPSLQRLDLHDRGAMVAADPQHRARAGLVDEHAPDVGRARQQVLDDPVGLRIEPRHP